MTPTLGAEIATGRTSDIFEWVPGQIIKVLKPTAPSGTIEKEVHDSVTAYALGITPIRCYGEVVLDDGRRGVAFDRVTGDALTTVAEKRPYLIPAVGRILAREHAAIHATHSSDFRDIRDVATDLLDTGPLAPLSETDRAALRRYLQSLPGGDSVLHLDFHPLNVFEHNDATATIDWQSTASGHPAADVAATCLLFTEAELFPGISAFQKVLYQSVRRIMLGFYLREYRRITGMDSAATEQWMTAARILRLGWLNVDSERDHLLTLIRAGARGEH
ncbi:MAG: phosphotransferase [Gordonia sp. (in: high G+C Gram-positive bacteria)]